jgi:tetratricopeptide (TPR) repeat protein
VTTASTPAQVESGQALPLAAPIPVDAATPTEEAAPAQLASSRTDSSAVIRSSAQSNPQLRGGVSSGGRPLAPSGSNSGYVSLRRSNGDSNYEEKRLTQAIDAGGNNGRDLAGLYQQRALLLLNQGDSERAIPDFQKAIELYSAMIQNHDRTKEAQDGLRSSKNGLKIASKTQVF